jgi:hypothetical protein
LGPGPHPGKVRIFPVVPSGYLFRLFALRAALFFFLLPFMLGFLAGALR